MQARSAACSLRWSGISDAAASSSGRESSTSFSIGSSSSSSSSSSTRNRRRNRQTQLVASALAEPSAFRPCIDIHKGKVKQIVGSTLSDLDKATSSAPVTNFESALPPSHYSELYKKNELRGGHVIMLGADEASQGAARDALAAWPGSLQVGGGVSASNAASWLSAGASHVIVTSAVFRDGRLDEAALRELVRLVGRERLVLDLSCRRKKKATEKKSPASSSDDDPYFVVTDRWQKYSDLRVDARTLEALAASCAEFLVHAVDVEGKSAGIDAELISILGRHSPIPVTYAGGASTIADLERVAEAGRGRVDVTVGSALDIFGGALPFEEVVAWSRREERRRGGRGGRE